jgi:hypothetical protein
MAALLSAITRRWFLRLAAVSVLAVLVIGSWMLLPLSVWAPIWSLAMIGALVLASLHDTGDEADS